MENKMTIETPVSEEISEKKSAATPQIGVLPQIVMFGLFVGMGWVVVKCEQHKEQQKHDEFMRNFKIDSAANKATISLPELEKIYEEKIKPQ
jgi:hypothetical protein